MTFFIVSLLACVSAALAQPPVSSEKTAVRYKINPPPSADLSYAIKARQSGLNVDGTTSLQWQTTGNKFSVSTETRAALVGKILEAKSEGVINEFGLAPNISTEKRFRKPPSTVTFDRQAKKISFSKSDQAHPIKGGEQDRSSIVWQLSSIARAAPAKMKPGSAWTFIVAGQNDAEPWTFKVVKKEQLKTPLGDVNTVHIVRMPPDTKGQQLDIWLAPSLEWYPVRLRFTDPDNDYIEQTLQKISKK